MENNCKCYIRALMLNPERKHPRATIKRAHERLKTNIKDNDGTLTVEQEIRITEAIDRALEALLLDQQSQETTKMPEHNCEEYEEAVRIIKRVDNKPKNREKTNETGTMKDNEEMGERPTPQFKLQMEGIRAHFYKKRAVLFRCNWEGYNLETTETSAEVAKFQNILGEYLKKLSPRAISTIIKREPILAIGLRK